MLHLTEEARDALRRFLPAENPPLIRIHLTGNGCSGSKLDLILDDKATPKDLKITEDGFQFCIKGDLMEALGDVTMDFTGEFFEFTSPNELPPSRDTCCGRCNG